MNLPVWKVQEESDSSSRLPSASLDQHQNYADVLYYRTINMSFLFVKAMTNGNPDGASNVFLSYMYQEAYTNSSYGYGMAIGTVVFLFSFTWPVF